MNETEWVDSNLLDVLGDEHCRQALVIANESPVTAAVLADRLEVSPPTVYRRLDCLIEHGLMREHPRIDSDGNHYRTFETTVDRIEVELSDSGYELTIRRRQNLADQFDAFWTDFMDGASTEASGRNTNTDDTHSDDTPPSL